MKAPGAARIGISGWRYPPWRKVFYPDDLPQRRELEFASRALATLEINGSFYSLQRPSSYETWRRETPEGFVFAVKGSRFITHNKRLAGGRPPLANFFASGVLALEEKLGPLLWQLPPQLPFDAERLEAFLDALPQSTAAAAELAREHDARLRGRVHLEVHRDRPLRHAFEVRHPSFDDPAFFRLLRRRNAALVVADTAGRWPSIEELTADFVYVRLHGAKELYASGYTGAQLDRWAARVRAWRGGRRPHDVFVYFDNDVKVRAPFDAINLAARLGQGERVAFPRKRLAAAEAARGVEEPRPPGERWRFTRRAA